jgi:hypothetical protein
MDSFLWSRPEFLNIYPRHLVSPRLKAYPGAKTLKLFNALLMFTSILFLHTVTFLSQLGSVARPFGSVNCLLSSAVLDLLLPLPK